MTNNIVILEYQIKEIREAMILYLFMVHFECDRLVVANFMATCYKFRADLLSAYLENEYQDSSQSEYLYYSLTYAFCQFDKASNTNIF